MKFNVEQFLFRTFFDVMHIFGGVESQTESTIPFLYIIILQRWKSFEPNSSAPVGDRHVRSQTFFRKFKAKQLLFQTFFDVMRIFGSVEAQNESTFPFLYIIIFQKWESFEPPCSTLER